MSDLADKAQGIVEMENEEKLGSIRKAASQIPEGEPGECEYCGYDFIRLVGGACGRCRDIHGLP